MKFPSHWTFTLQVACLVAQLCVSLLLGIFGWSFETFVVFLVTFVAQGLLLIAITPREKAWNHRKLNVHPRCPVMLHKGLDSMGLLFVRNVKLDGKDFGLEEYCWKSQSIRNVQNKLSVVIAFAAFVLQIILIGWTITESRLLYFMSGKIGLITNAIEGAFEPNWSTVYDIAFKGEAFCEPEGSTLISAVGILLAADHSVAELI